MASGAQPVLPPEDLDLARDYGLFGLRDIEAHRAIFKLKHYSGEFALKCVGYTLDQMTFLQEVLNFLDAKGFKNTPRIVPNNQGGWFTRRSSGAYFLMEWLPGRESNFLDLRDLEICARTLGILHKLTLGFRPSGREWQDTWATCYKELAKIDVPAQSYLYKLKTLWPQILRAGEQTLRLLQDPLVRASLGQPAVICHHDLSHRNFLIGPHNEGFLIDFDYALADVPMRDLAHFLGRVLKRHSWDLEVALFLLSCYEKENPLSKGDYGALLAFLYFPRSLWGLVKRLRSNPSRVESDELTAKVLSSLARQEAVKQLEKCFGV